MTHLTMTQLKSPPTSYQVLLVEDNPADVFLLEAALEEAELELQLRVAEDGVVALDMLSQAAQQRELPDVVLLDLNMPRMNGFELLEAVRSSPLYPELPVVVLTTSAALVDRERSLRLGANAFVTKPQGFSDILSLSARLIDALLGRASWQQLGEASG